MNKLYNSQKDFSSKLSKFFKSAIPDIRKTQLNIIPYIILGMILSESCVPVDIAKSLKDDFSTIQVDSVIKRIRRFFSNKHFYPYKFYKDLIVYVIKKYVCKHDDKIVYITFDHMYSKENFTVFMMTLRVGTFGIPIWFKCFKDISNNDAFKLKTIKRGIKAVSNMFKDTGLKLVFLGDRFFGSPKLFQLIDSLGHTYCIRLKGNIIVHKDKEKIKAKKLKHHKYHSTTHKDIKITKDRYKTTIVYSSSENTKDPWIIATNGNPKKAIKSYSYRFASIEFLFKSQKSNGFNLEKITNASLKSFETMYTMICVCNLYLTALGIDYTKNTRCYKNVKIETHKTYNINGVKKRKRIMSLFNVGLTLFKRAFNSLIYIRIPVSFKLYDI